ETNITKRMNKIRKQKNIASKENLEKKISEQGISFEDFKANIRNRLLTDEVIRREAGSHIIIGRDEIQKYYDQHKNEFQRPEQVYLREIFVSTEGKKDEEIREMA